MKIYYELDLKNFKAWSGGKYTLEELTFDEIEKLQDVLDSVYEEMDETELNDLLWFENDTIADWLGYSSWEALEKIHKYGDEVTVNIYDIKWDTDEDDDDDVELPVKITHEFDYNGDNDDLVEAISEWLSDEYAYCHEGFNYKIKEES